MIKKYSLLAMLMLVAQLSNATHNRAGEITYKQISALTYEITLTTYTSTRPGTADRPQLDIYWGDGTFNTVDRFSELYLPDFYKRNTYVYRHTYPGAGTFKISVEDPNRNEGVANIPESVNVKFAISTTLQINPLLGYNNTPILLNPPIDNAAQNRIFIHNPAAFDPDGDSLSYELTECLGDNGNPIPGYLFPESTNIPIYVNPVTGDLVWDAPPKVGIFNVAIAISEWRHGIKIGKIIRDMQIEVRATNNYPPYIYPIDPYCVVAGEYLEFQVNARDSAIDRIEMKATGGPFEVNVSKATFEAINDYANASGIFRWNTVCNHIRKSPYQVIFKAEDHNTEVNLVDIKSTSIQVISPPPTIVSLTPSSNTINISWKFDACDNHVGYRIYRREGTSGFEPGTCQTGLPPETGFKLVKRITDTDLTSWLDNNNGIGLYQGHQYCYRVSAIYADSAESIISNEACENLVNGIPTITRVSVEKTGINNGEIEIRWNAPTEFDNIAAPGPYKYLIYRSEDLWGTNLILIDSIDGINNTKYIDRNLNTKEKYFSYSVAFYNNSPGARFLIGMPQVASAPRLRVEGSDNTVSLRLEKNVPWLDTAMIVYKLNQTTQVYDSIGYATNMTYKDKGLNNGVEYCYFIKTLGKYTATLVTDTIANKSQISCATPVDTVPPCAPVLTVTSLCNDGVNVLRWTNPENTCDEEVVKYNIYFTPVMDGTLELIHTLFDADDTIYNHTLDIGLAGCYLVTAVDSFSNESRNIARVCVDVCHSKYVLPNVFTPDGNSTNDKLTPIESDNVDKVDFKLFNRQGILVFETNDPQINWDGKYKDNGKQVSPGVYYYVCDVYERRLSGLEPRNITGFVHIFYKSNSTNP